MFRMCARNYHSYTHLLPALWYRVKAYTMGFIASPNLAHMTWQGYCYADYPTECTMHVSGTCTPVLWLLTKAHGPPCADYLTECIMFPIAPATSAMTARLKHVMVVSAPRPRVAPCSPL